MNQKVIRHNLKTIVRETTYSKKPSLSLCVVAMLSLGAMIAYTLVSTIDKTTSAVTCPAGPCNANFQVNVQDTMTVSVTAPVNGASGNIGEFLRNTVHIEVDSNVSDGFTASMHSLDTADLIHATVDPNEEGFIPTLSSSSTRQNFASGYWGYSLKSASLDGKTYGETDAGNNSSYYYPMTTSTLSPIMIMQAASGTKSGTQDIYFGAKPSESVPSGTYNNTVIISVVTGTINSNTNPYTPTNPVTPETDSNPSGAVYTGNNSTQGTGVSGSNGTTVFTNRYPSTDEVTTVTEISAGDHTNSYFSPMGVSVNTQSNIVEGDSGLPVGLAATVIASATAGTIFFILAKRDEDDEEDEEELY